MPMRQHRPEYGGTEMKKYNIIYADPPWQYNDKMVMTGVHGAIRGAHSFYDTMSMSQIKTLPIKSLAADNCVLFMWITMPLLDKAFEVMTAWGFKYKTCGFTWVKTTKNGKIHLGMGHYTRGNAELCLIGVKGKNKIQSHVVSQIVMSEIGRHSAKPAIIRDKIVELLGDVPRIELFAREKAPGWDSWGNEIESDIGMKEMNDVK